MVIENTLQIEEEVACIRLTTGGEIVEISGYGMQDFFRDEANAKWSN